MSIGEIHIIEEWVKPILKMILWVFISIVLWTISWKEHFPLIFHYHNMLLVSIIFFFNAPLKIFIILGKHLGIGKKIILITWMLMFTLTLLSPQLHLVRKAKGCKISMVEAMMTLYVMTWMIVWLAICLIIWIQLVETSYIPISLLKIMLSHGQNQSSLIAFCVEQWR